MEPIGLVEKSGKGWQVVHRCTACGHRQPNRLVRDGDAPSDLDLLLSLPWLCHRGPPGPHRIALPHRSASSLTSHREIGRASSTVSAYLSVVALSSKKLVSQL